MTSNPNDSTIVAQDYFWLLLANFATLLNLLCGLAGIFYSLNKDISGAFQLLLLGAFFDLFDGKLAKKSNIKSSFGDYADSFADLMTFALLPGFMVLALDSALWLGDIELVSKITLGQLFAGVYAVGGWYRLIRFSSKPTGNKFEGLPSPAAAMLIGSLTIVVVDPNLFTLPLNVILTIAIVATGLLMGSNIDYPSPKRMMQSDNTLITVAGIIGFFYVIVPNVISAFLVVCISVFYTLAGPYYYFLTEKQIQI